jgi:phosphate transport system substrate-binding protein
MNPRVSLRTKNDRRMTGKVMLASAWVATVQLLSQSGVAAGADTEIHGIGATFPAPIYAAWAADYRRETGVIVRYDPAGSGAGIRAMRESNAAAKVDFGGTDIPLAAGELQSAGLLQFPVVIGGLVAVINMRGLKPGAMKLSGQLLGDIYLGRITRWNDPAIAALNPGIALPSEKITVVHRSDSSGSTSLWSSYLSESNPEWQSRLGSHAELAWPVGVGGEGNEGVAAYVDRTRASLGYVEYEYAKQHRLSFVSVDDRFGTFSIPSRAAFESQTWPLTGASYILLKTMAVSPKQSRAVLDFLDWAISHGAQTARRLNYVPLSSAAAAATERRWAQEIHDSTGAPVFALPAVR